MSIRWAESGGQYHFSVAAAAGVFGSGASVGIINNAASRNNSTYAYQGNVTVPSPNVGSTGGFNGMIAGGAFYTGATFNNNSPFIKFMDNVGPNEQCSVRVNGSGQLFFSRNGTNLGAGNPTVSANVLPINAWVYIEFKASFATGATGTCEVRVNGVVWLTLTSVQNATTTAKGWQANFVTQNAIGAAGMDFYVLDTDGTTISGDNNYLGDITVAEIYPNGAGANSAWGTGTGAVLTSIAASGAASFTLTSVNTTALYNGTITGGASNAYIGYYFVITGFTNGANNITGLCSASSATQLQLVNQSNGTITTVSETHSGTATIQAAAQIGIHGGIVDSYSTSNVGTRPDGDAGFYIYDSTTNDKSDFAHQALALTGTIMGVIHRTYMKKDDAGARSVAQICESPYASSPTEEIGSTVALGTSYSYYDDIVVKDPATNAAWTLSGFNNASFGVKLIS